MLCSYIELKLEPQAKSLFLCKIAFIKDVTERTYNYEC